MNLVQSQKENHLGPSISCSVTGLFASINITCGCYDRYLHLVRRGEHCLISKVHQWSWWLGYCTPWSHWSARGASYTHTNKASRT